MNWETIKENLSAFFGMDVVVAVITATLSFVYLLVIVAQTPIGKRVLNSLKSKISNFEEKASKMESELEEFKAEKEDEISSLTENYEKKLSVVLSENLELEGIICKIGELIPNTKVKEAIAEFASGKTDRLATISETIKSSADFEQLRKEAEEARANAENEAKALYEAKIAEADKLLAQLKEKAESVLSAPLEKENEEE